MKIAAYARSATAPSMPTRDVPAIRKQLSSIKNWAGKNQHEVVETYTEVVSAFPNQGTEFLRMLEKAKSDEHPYDAIVCFEHSRLSRNNFQLCEIEQLLENKYQVKVIEVACECKAMPEALPKRLMETFDDLQKLQCSRGRHQRRK